MMVAIHDFHVEYGHCTVKQMYENVFNNVVKVANGLGVSLATPSIATNFMEDIGSSDDKNISTYPWLNYCMNVP